MLGYFLIIGFFWVYCFFGDFSFVFKIFDDIEFNKKVMFVCVMVVYFIIYYYVGFFYMMMCCYVDVFCMFSYILIYVFRIKNFQKNVQYDNINKKSDQMFVFIVICVVFQFICLDDIIYIVFCEKYGEQFLKFQCGGFEFFFVFEEFFCIVCFKFIFFVFFNFDVFESNIDFIEYYFFIFMEEVKINMFNFIIKFYFCFYIIMDFKKLVGFFDVKFEEFCFILFVNKQCNKQIWWNEGVFLEGEWVNISDFDYVF